MTDETIEGDWVLPEPPKPERKRYDPNEKRKANGSVRFELNKPDADFLGNRVPPNDLEAERITLSAMMQSPEAARKAFKLLQTDTFYSTAHQALFSIMKSIFGEGRFFDWFMLKKEAEAAGILESLGGDAGFLELINAAPNWAMVDEYAKIVQTKSIQRAVVSVSTQLLSAAYDIATPIDELVSMTRSASSAVRNHKPEMMTIREMIEAFPVENEIVVEGLLRRCETANVIAPSKIGKSHLVMMLAYALASGGVFLGRQCLKCKVLIIDNELNPPTISARNQSLQKHDPETKDGSDNITVWSLRGNLKGITEVCERDLTGFDVIILDAWYRFNDGDENSNGDVTRIYNQLDQMAAKTNAALVAVHHMSKGNQSEKAITDAGAGAGAQSRAADTHIVIRQHECEDCYVLDAVVRSFPPPEPVVIQKQYPVFVLRTDLDPEKLYGRKPSREDDIENKEGLLLRLIPIAPLGITKQELMDQTGLGSRSIEKVLPGLEKSGNIRAYRTNQKSPKIYSRIVGKSIDE